MLTGKKVLVCVCGGIAAYKVVEVVSRLKKLNAEVTVMMTESAKTFITPLTFQSISLNKVYHNMFTEDEPEIKHIILAQQCDLIVVAPATANIIGKITAGIADDLVTTTLIASNQKILLVPAMNTQMYLNVVVQENLEKLVSRGYTYMLPESGTMAMKAEGSGIGRLPDPETIVNRIIELLN